MSPPWRVQGVHTRRPRTTSVAMPSQQMVFGNSCMFNRASKKTEVKKNQWLSYLLDSILSQAIGIEMLKTVQHRQAMLSQQMLFGNSCMSNHPCGWRRATQSELLREHSRLKSWGNWELCSAMNPCMYDADKKAASAIDDTAFLLSTSSGKNLFQVYEEMYKCWGQQPLRNDCFYVSVHPIFCPSLLF